MLTPIHICLLLALAVVAASAQLCLKWGAMQGHGKGMAANLFQPWVWAGGILMLVNMLVFTWILRQVSLTSAVPFAALVYVLVPLGARHFLAERLMPRFWLGSLLIGVGVGLTLI